MIIITGAAGFIGSCLVQKLNILGHENLILVDDFSKQNKAGNYQSKKYLELIERNLFLEWFNSNANKVDWVFHIGARTDTTEFNVEIFNELNLNYTKRIWEICSENQIGLVYASSAATYGLGEFGYNDDEKNIPKLKPLNPYGESKNDFDIWALAQKKSPPFWYGLKFFNVYGPNEYHKGRMASVIFHSFNQINQNKNVKLFRSHNPNYKDGEQLRDFVYVKDVVDVICFLYTKKPKSGVYNLGSGEARSFKDLALAVFHALEVAPSIEYIDTPVDIRDKYQYFTEANMQKLKNAGYENNFTSLEDGVSDYVCNYLMKNAFF
ncbi:MAG: ADP-glyceromanno-heptose 6-epimerase [Bacteroidia bacterium]